MENSKKLIFNIFVFIFYFIYSIVPIAVMKIFHLRLLNPLYKSIFLIFMCTLYILFITFLYRKELKEDLKSFNIKYIFKYIPIYLLGILLMGLSNFILSNITGSNLSQNEINIRENIKLLPIYMSFSAVVFAPIVEEITFRKTFRNIISDNVLFVLISGSIFGIVHLSGSTTNDMLMIIQYIIMGIDLSYIYYYYTSLYT